MRSRLIRFLVAVSLWISVGACNSAAPTAPSLHRSLHYLASDEMEGRGVGTAGLDRAADYVAKQFRQIGLRPPPDHDNYFQPFKITTTTGIDPASRLTLDLQTLAAAEDYVPTSFSAEKSFAGEAVFVGYGISSKEHGYDDYAGLDVSGKVALAMRFEPHDSQGRSRFAQADWSHDAWLINKAKAAAQHGAVALLLVNPPEFHGPDLLMPFARQFRDRDASIPVIHVSQQSVNRMLEQAGAKDLKTLQDRIDQSASPNSFALSGVSVEGDIRLKRTEAVVKNVMGYLPGRGATADEYVVVGAHYDHLGRGRHVGATQPSEIYNGADDNASGTVALLDIARRLAQGPPPQRSILFVAFTAEELGLLGSNHFVEHPPVTLEKIVAMLNLDMVGRINGSMLYVGGGGTAEPFESILTRADDRSPLQLKSIGKGGLGPSDHMSFALKKVPVLFLFSGVHRDYHRPTDDADKINYDGLRHVIALATDVTRELTAMPRAQYVDAADAHSAIRAMGGGSRVMLGVVPDYGTDETIGGVRISGTVPESPAAAAGLRPGDILTAFGEQKIESLYDLSDALARAKPGQKVTLQLIRGGQTLQTEATLVERKG